MNPSYTNFYLTMGHHIVPIYPVPRYQVTATLNPTASDTPKPKPAKKFWSQAPFMAFLSPRFFQGPRVHTPLHLENPVNNIVC